MAQGRGTYLKDYGVADLAGGRPMGVDDRFRVGSVTRTSTATVVLGNAPPLSAAVVR